jgi:hypothetical protein
MKETGQETEGGGRAAGRYAAFVSYSHADDEIADWLHRRLEGYRVPKGIAAARKDRRLGKLFRDRVELASSHDLGGDIRKALDASDALILLCSPRSAKSPYVAEEIRRFKETGKREHIIAVIVDGEPHAAGKPGRSADEECFPRALLYRVERDGAIGDRPEPTEPIAADVRAGRDGRENGALKIIAALLGAGLDDLVQREKQAERARRRRANAIAAAMAVLALGAVGGGGFAWWMQQEAERQTAQAAWRLSDNIARDTDQWLDQGAYETALLLALQADPAANRTDVSRRLVGSEGYPLARAKLVAAYSNVALTRMFRPIKGQILSTFFGPDGPQVLVEDVSGPIQLLDVRNGALLQTFAVGSTQAQYGVHSARGHRLAISWQDGTTSILNARTGQVVANMPGDGHAPTALAISADGNSVVVAHSSVGSKCSTS